MILSTHFITGAAVASQTDSPLLIIILPLLLHFILDLIPHWEYVDEASELKNNIPKIIIDILAGPIVILLISVLTFGLDSNLIAWLFLGGIISVIPDGFSLLHLIFPKNLALKQIFSFHQTVHSKKMLNIKIGFAVQLIIDILAIILITLPKA